MNDISIRFFLFTALILWVYMTTLFVIALLKKDNSIADIGYGVGFIVVIYAGLYLAPNSLSYFGSLTLLTLATLVTCWGARLALRIYLKNKGKPEDFRYVKWRGEWKWFYLRSYMQIFMLQGLIIYLIALPILLLVSAGGLSSTNSPLLYVGVGIWLAGFFFEAVGDRQLDQFLKTAESKGKLMTTGLWAYTRHPNYFGESTMWWGIFLATYSMGHQWWILGLVSPLLITFLLLKVSGIPLLEAKMSQHPDWPLYAAKTNAFLPWFPKKLS